MEVKLKFKKNQIIKIINKLIKTNQNQTYFLTGAI